MIRFRSTAPVLLPILGLGLALTACASSPELTVEWAPLQPIELKQVQLLTEDAEQEVVSAVRRALEGQGAELAEASWLVEAALAVRPVTVGGFSDEEARAGEWTEAPRKSGARRGKNLHTLTVVLSQIDSPQRRTAQVSARHNDVATPQSLLQQLAQTAVTAALQGHQED